MNPRETDNRPIIAAYVMGGTALGAAEPLLAQLLDAAGWGGPVALLLALPLAFPTLVVLLSLSRPRTTTICFGTFLAAAAWLAANLIARSGRPLALALPLALLVWPITAFLAILLASARGRRNGHVCRACGYALTGLRDPRCPECGTPFDPPAADHSDAGRVP
ncbi:MAG: hypothetical protein CHACPFDD_02364 [Phycisphaerae bacterium]|nr:hypothetical protein [Phycisphaerae bacterium]